MKKVLISILPYWLHQKLRYIRMQYVLTSARIAKNAVGRIDSEWRQRIDSVIACPDNAAIPRVPDAGKLQGYVITMHNGVRVCANSYYGNGILNMLIENRGVHEPQEELVFEAVCRHLREDCTMLELGAYWGFYSLSLLQQRPRAKCFLVEPDSANLLSGKVNFRLNQRTGCFVHAGVDRTSKAKPPTISVDSFCREREIDHLDVLHADIQGYELLMLEGANEMLSSGRVDFVFISTHSTSLHADCIKALKSAGYCILAEADSDQMFSYDGLIVAKHNGIKQPEGIKISKKRVS